MSGTATVYTVVNPSSAVEFSNLLASAAVSGEAAEFDATSELEELTQIAPRTFTVLVDVMHARPPMMFEVSDENTSGAFRIQIPLAGPVKFTIFG